MVEESRRITIPVAAVLKPPPVESFHRLQYRTHLKIFF
ncbi:MAG: hypothetical protein [Olavius algarvensis Delta 4 endosymbiont]|nr:MAG: hypothetical protein [Olavius algarvensis Delta 4 endosymbiont]